ncbi:MAG: 1-acyl-sn-glycerol-3-phosphate acyltransferase [Spirochaetales bacterium]|nr:1-acyl-sn-glycerol-3-phosphate acyltransferase [Spirochaetales bacterium]
MQQKLRPLMEQYPDILRQMKVYRPENRRITPENVFQEGHRGNRPLIDAMVEDLLLPGSRVRNLEHLIELYNLAQKGKSCLILMEHYSNFDVVALYYLLEQIPEIGRSIADSIVSIAGMKLNEDEEGVLKFTECYTRLVIYPSRGLQSIEDPELRAKEEQRSKEINIASMRTMVRLKNNGRMFLVFPSGTRFRSWDKSSRKGVKEVDTYLKSFDYMVMIAANGNILHVNPGLMMNDVAARDLMYFSSSPVYSCSGFRERFREETPEGEDPKQYVADMVMHELEAMHESAEKERERELEELEKTAEKQD